MDRRHDGSSVIIGRHTMSHLDSLTSDFLTIVASKLAISFLFAEASWFERVDSVNEPVAVGFR